MLCWRFQALYKIGSHLPFKLNYRWTDRSLVFTLSNKSLQRAHQLETNTERTVSLQRILQVSKQSVDVFLLIFIQRNNLADGRNKEKTYEWRNTAISELLKKSIFSHHPIITLFSYHSVLIRTRLNVVFTFYHFLSLFIAFIATYLLWTFSVRNETLLIDWLIDWLIDRLIIPSTTRTCWTSWCHQLVEMLRRQRLML